MAHVELSLSEAFLPASRHAPPIDDTDSLDRWWATVADAVEPCLVIDAEAIIQAVSMAACELLGLGVPAEVIGLPLLGGVLRLIDFTAARSELTEAEADKIPPLLALSSGRLARGLLRVQPPGADPATVDAIAAPLCRDGLVAGSLTFFAPV